LIFLCTTQNLRVDVGKHSANPTLDDRIGRIFRQPYSWGFIHACKFSRRASLSIIMVVFRYDNNLTGDLFKFTLVGASNCF